jgi:hypothetical protein
VCYSSLFDPFVLWVDRPLSCDSERCDTGTWNHIDHCWVQWDCPVCLDFFVESFIECCLIFCWLCRLMISAINHVLNIVESVLFCDWSEWIVSAVVDNRFHFCPLWVVSKEGFDYICWSKLGTI